MKHQTVPLRFRLWDNEECHFVRGLSDFRLYLDACLQYDTTGRLCFEKDSRFIITRYTGLRDKCGSELFEGDIISARGEVYQVYWDEEVATWRALGDDWDDLYCIAREAEIIGNIFADPELLEKV